MADNTLRMQGSFTADGSAKEIEFRGGITWMKVYNMTTTAAGGAGTGVEFKWFKGMAADYAIEYQKLAADESMVPVIATSGGFTLINTATDAKDAAINSTVTAISAAAIPIVSAASTTGLVAGDIVRFASIVGAQQFGGVDFEIDTVNANTNFRLVYAPQIVAGTTGSFYPVITPAQFYPRTRFISKITAASPAVITTTVSHGLTVGQQFRLRVTSNFGMTEINGLVATVISKTASTITTDIDASTFTAFAWPLTAAVANGVTHAQIVPFGMDGSSTYSGDVSDARVDQGKIAMRLAAGTDSPAGAANDEIFWEAGRAFSVDNE